MNKSELQKAWGSIEKFFKKLIGGVTITRYLRVSREQLNSESSEMAKISEKKHFISFLILYTG